MPARTSLAISMTLLVLAIVFMIMGMRYMLQGDEVVSTAMLAAAMALTIASWLTSRSVAAARETPIIRMFEVSTELTCSSCGFKEVRAFRQGDYVFKPAGACPRCGGERFITAIFREEGSTPT